MLIYRWGLIEVPNEPALQMKRLESEKGHNGQSPSGSPAPTALTLEQNSAKVAAKPPKEHPPTTLESKVRYIRLNKLLNGKNKVCKSVERESESEGI